MARVALLLPFLAALAGCSAARHGRDATVAARDADALRLARVLRTGADLARATAHGERIDLGLSTRDALGAWSWPDGRIRVSRALVDALDDDELRAALAHEIGHLLDAGTVAGGTSALAGGPASSGHDAAGIETRADALACGLLRAGGADAAALPRMLRTVASHSTPADEDRDAERLLQRARVAERACATPR